MDNLADWKYYKIEDLFNVFTGTDLILRDITDSGEFFITSHKKQNNSVALNTNIIQDRKLFNCNNTISIADRGCFVATVQTKDFYIGTRVKALQLKYEFSNKYILLFLSTIINLEQFRYSYGRNCCDDLGKIQIKLPTITKQPNWQYMEDYIKSLINKITFSKITTKNKKTKINKDNWQWFDLEDIFLLEKGKDSAQSDTDGEFNLISATKFNNGVSGKKDSSNYFNSNLITVSSNGEVGEAFYQDSKICATCDVNVLIPKNKSKLNKYNALFISTIIRCEKYKYTYGRKWGIKRMEKTKIKLPAIKRGNITEPNWQYMEDYIKSLPYGDLL